MKNTAGKVAFSITAILFLSMSSCNSIDRPTQTQGPVNATNASTNIPIPTHTVPTETSTATATQFVPTETLTETPIPTATVPSVVLRAVPVNNYQIAIINYRNGSTLKTIDIWPQKHIYDLGQLAWSPDGKKLVFRANQADLYIYSLETKKLEIIEPIHNTQSFNGHVDWSPDNNWIAFGMNSSGSSKIYLIHPDGTGYHSIFEHSDGSAEVTSWTSDSKYIIFYIFKGNSASGCYSDIWIIDRDGKRPQKLVSDYLSCGALNVAVSPDGKTIYYRSDPGTYMSPIDCYYSNSCENIPSEAAIFPDTWFKDFTPRWTGKYRTFYEKGK